MKVVLKWITCVVAMLLAWKIFPDIVRCENADIWALVATGTVLWLVNLCIRPVVKALSFPITFMTLGLFGLVINALMVELAAWVVPKISLIGISGFFVSIGISVLVSVMNVVLTGKK